MKKVLILANHFITIYAFRKELVNRLLDKNYDLYIALPESEDNKYFSDMGCTIINASVDRRGVNPIKDLKLVFCYKKIIKQTNPDMVLTFTIKPNIYGGIICRITRVPYISNITGLSSAIEGKRIVHKPFVLLYRAAFKNINRVFCQNKENMQFFADNKIAPNKLKLIPGSGVNLEYFASLEYPPTKTIHFLFISRIMKEKGIDQYLEAAEYIKGKYPKTFFHVLGFCEEAYESKLKRLESQGIIKYHGMQDDVRRFHKISHCTIHPTYYPEGISNVLLESAACGRPVITTDRSGCQETVDDGVTGFITKQRNTKDLIDKIEKFIRLSYVEKKSMGLAGRKKVEKEFDRKVVVQTYLEEIEKVISKK